MPDRLRDADSTPDDTGSGTGIGSESGAGAEWEALARYTAGESTPAEVAAVRAWLASHPAAAELVESVLPRVVTTPEAHVELQVEPQVDVERALATVRARIAAEGAAGASAPALTVSAGGARPLAKASRPAAAPRPWYAGGRGLAAAAAVLLTIGFGARGLVQRDGTAASVVATARVYETAIGVRDSVTLADGSRVVLAPGSRLTVPASFDSARTVDLDGAAYFEVRHDEAHPFTVRSRGAEVRDIGTAFSVTTDATGSVSVAVTEGIVALRSTATPDAKGVELKAGDRGVIHGRSVPEGASPGGDAPSGGDELNAVEVTRGGVTDEDIAWTRGDLSYRDAPLSIVQADLRRWYGINLVVTDSGLLRQTLKISFRGDSADAALRKMALALGAETVQRGDTVLLRKPAGASGSRR